jgi:hypothetical protein
MGMAVDIEAVRDKVRQYANGVREILPVVRAFLYGPWGDGTAKDEFWDRIQVCFILKDFGGRTLLELIKDLVILSKRYDLTLAPSPFLESPMNPYDTHLESILKSGIDV